MKKKIFISRILVIVMLLLLVLTPMTASYKQQAATNRGFISSTGGAYLRSAATTQSNKISLLADGTPLEILAKVTGEKVDGYGTDQWYQVKTSSETGYVFGELVMLDTIVVPDLPPDERPVPGTPLSDAEFETMLANEKFPESYRVKLRALHKSYPTWRFVNTPAQASWDAALDGEMGSVNYWSDGSAVTRADLAKYMDPRNWLDAASVFMFIDNHFDKKSQNSAGVAGVLEGGFMDAKNTFEYVKSDGTKATGNHPNAFLAAGNYSKLSPYLLATRVRQEIGNAYSGVHSVVSGEFRSDTQKDIDFTGLYNYYNIGAFDGPEARTNAMLYAKYGNDRKPGFDSDDLKGLLPWTDRYRSIVGGAYLISEWYVLNPRTKQDTLYTQKFNVLSDTGLYGHQYMSNIEAPSSESWFLSKAYRTGGAYGCDLTFKIPVFANMPEGNNIITGLVDGYTIKNEYLFAANSTSKITVEKIRPAIKLAPGYSLKFVETNKGVVTSGPFGTGSQVEIYRDSDSVRVMLLNVIMYGDVMGSGFNTSANVQRIFEGALGKRQLSGVFKMAADINSNGMVDSDDVYKSFMRCFLP